MTFEFGKSESSDTDDKGSDASIKWARRTISASEAAKRGEAEALRMQFGPNLGFQGPP